MFRTESLDFEEASLLNQLTRDYLRGADELREFFEYLPTEDSVSKVIKDRSEFNTDRELLVRVMKDQTKNLSLSDKTKTNIERLKNSNTFTVCVAHQTNLFTGPLYFIVKILCAIRTAHDLKKKFSDHHFVPVYWMGSEDHDLDELNHFHLFGEKHEWKTKQTGATGRILLDDEVEQLIAVVEDKIGNFEHSEKLILDLKSA